MTCDSCQAFEANPLSGSFRAGCTECATRSIAQSPSFFESQRQGAITAQYRAALERAFHGDVKAGHLAVKNFAEKLKLSGHTVI